VFQREGTATSAPVTIFTQVFHEPPPVPGHEALLSKWTQIRAVRAEALKRIETLREQGQVGSSLQAEIDITADGERHALLGTLGDELKYLTVTSAARLHLAGAGAEPGIAVRASALVKCERCWHYCDDIGAEPEHPSICGRCADNLFGAGEARAFV
jgi:isoleucyl-tRNA synthetase